MKSWIPPLVVIPFLLAFGVGCVSAPVKKDTPKTSLPLIEINSKGFMTHWLEVIQNKSFIAMGESIPMTHEFPDYGYDFIHALYLKAHFNVLAFDISPIDAWLTQDNLLNSDRPSAMARDARQTALSSEGQSQEMKKILLLAAKSIRQKEPLYLAGLSLKIGKNIKSQKGESVFLNLITALGHYGLAFKGQQAKDMIRAITPLKDCEETGFPRTAYDAPQALEAIGKFNEYINQVIKKVETKFPDLPHAHMLRSLPEFLKFKLSVCQQLQTKPNHPSYLTFSEALISQTRKNFAPHGKIIYWTQLSQIQMIKKSTQNVDDSYFLAWLGGDGENFELPPSPYPPKIKKILPVKNYSFEAMLSPLTESAVFLDLSGLSPQSDDAEIRNLFSPQTVRSFNGDTFKETDLKATVGQDFSGIVFIPKIEAAELESE